MSGASVPLLVACTGFVGAFGVLIRYFGRVELIAGYDPDRVTDEEGLANFVGTNALYVAALLGLVTVVEYTEPFEGSEFVSIAFVVGVFALTARMIVGARRYERRE